MIQSDRLTLTRMDENDAPFVYELCNSASYIQFIGDRGIRNLDLARDYIIDKYIKIYENPAIGNLKIIYQNRPIGTVGIFEREQLEVPDLGFALLPDFEKQGFAFEASKALINYAIDKKLLSKISAITLPENHSCIHLLKKLDFEYQNEILLDFHTKPFKYFLLDLSSLN